MLTKVSLIVDFMVISSPGKPGVAIELLSG
jgi:hypothetical protein